MNEKRQPEPREPPTGMTPQKVNTTTLCLFLVLVAIAGGTVCYAFTTKASTLWQISATLAGAIVSVFAAYAIYLEVIHRDQH